MDDVEKFKAVARIVGNATIGSEAKAVEKIRKVLEETKPAPVAERGDATLSYDRMEKRAKDRSA